MLMEGIYTCTVCNGNCVKNGKSKNGTQRFYCKQCRKSFQTTYRYKAFQRGITEWIASLTCEGCGIRSISRLLKIAVATVISRIKKLGQRLQRPFSLVKGKSYEIDELRTFIGNKKRLYWVAYAIERSTRAVVDFKVGKRTHKTLKRVVDTVVVAKANRVYTDGLMLYNYIVPSHLHKQASYNINYIERKNLSIRTHLKRLSRRTICFSRSIEMLSACLKIYFWSVELSKPEPLLSNLPVRITL